MKMTIDKAIEKYKNQAEWEHSHNNMDYCEEYGQLAKWLEQLQKIKDIVENHNGFTNGTFLAVCKSDFPLTKEVEKELKDTVFISDEPRYCFEMTEIKELMNKDTLTTVIPQEPVLDKIKKVVAKWRADNFTDGFAWDCMQDIADIIDKAESEEKK